MGHGLKEINAYGGFILDFSFVFYLTITNTRLRKREEDLVT